MTRKELVADMESRVAQAQKLLGDESKVEEYNGLISKIKNIGEQIRAVDNAEAELRAAKEAEAKAPAPPEARAGSFAEAAKQLRSMIDNREGGAIKLGYGETRAILSNGAGVGTAPGIVRAMVDGGKLRSKVSVFTGPNAQTVVSVFAPHMATPVGSVPGATGTASDSTAVLTGDPLTLKAWYSTLAISMGALISTDIESYMPTIFQEAFGAAIDKAIVAGAGSGSDALGVFIASTSGVTTSQDVTATGKAAAPVWADYINIILQVLALGGNPEDMALVVHPSVFNSALGVTTNDPEKYEFMNRGTLLGVPVVLSSHALTTLTSGSYVAVCGNFKHYALAVAQEIYIDKIKTVGSDNVTFQAFMYMQGKPLVGSSFRRLKTGS